MGGSGLGSLLGTVGSWIDLEQMTERVETGGQLFLQIDPRFLLRCSSLDSLAVWQPQEIRLLTGGLMDPTAIQVRVHYILCPTIGVKQHHLCSTWR